MTVWDPAVYDRYKTYRERPALDLLIQVPRDRPYRQIWDLGCGTGEHAALLAARYPRARVHGLDASAEMLAEARKRSAPVEWVQGDIAGFAPAEPPDLIFSNAALHWLPGLEAVIPRLAAALAPSGVLAVQVPLSHDAPWYDALRETVTEPQWAASLSKVEGTQPVPAADRWHDLLSATCAVDIWTTTYLHVLEGDEPVLDWMRGTGLRPYLQALTDEDDRQAFERAYARRLATLIPKRRDGTTLLPFPRLFVIAQRVR